MKRRLIAAMTLLAVAVSLALSIPMVALVANAERNAMINELRVETLSTAARLATLAPAQWAAAVTSAVTRPDERVIIVDTNLRLVADSDAGAVDRGFTRPELRRALQGSLASDVRYSTTLGTDLRYVAAPVIQERTIIGAVRFSLPEDAVRGAVNRTVALLVVFVLAVAVLSAVVAWLLATSLASPVYGLARVARGLHEDLSLRADESAGPVEVRAVAVALNETAVRLQDLVHRTERVAVDASHHLRTPLTGIRLRLEGIEDVSTDPAIANEAHAALTEVDRLARRIDQVLALAKADAGNAHVQPVLATEVVRERVQAFAPIARERSIELSLQTQDGVRVMADVGALPRMLDELLSNALQYAQQRVEVVLTARDGFAAMTVSDDGPGVPVEERDSIFERFQRGAGAVPGGTGLGLAMVLETATACGGTAVAESGALGGLSVRVMLPLA